MKDVVDSGMMEILHAPTDEMEADFMTKPLQGSKFKEFRFLILGM